MKASVPRTPSYRHHKPSGQAFVEIDGRRYYLGKFELPATKQAYHRLVQEWIAGGYRLPIAAEKLTILELADAYLDHAAVYYGKPTGGQTSSYSAIEMALRGVLKLYGNVPAVQFGPNALRAVRQTWIDRGNAITTINGYANAVRAMFKWGVAHEMIPPETHAALCSLSGLRRGRGVGKDPKQRIPAPAAAVESVIPHLPRQLQAVVRLLLYTGARPSEVLNLKRGDIDITGDVWVAIIREHKTSYKGKERRLFFGPRAQSAVRPFLLRSDSSHLFSPKEAIQAIHANASVHRRPNQKPNPRKTERTLGDCYTYTSLNKAIRRVCDEYGIEVWTPYQLRHLAATTIEATADLQTASAILGHSGLEITQVYVHRDNKTAAAWAALHG